MPTGIVARHRGSCRPVERLASATACAARSGTEAVRAAVDVARVALPERGPSLDRALDLVRALDDDAHAAGRGAARRRSCGRRAAAARRRCSESPDLASPAPARIGTRCCRGRSRSRAGRVLSDRGLLGRRPDHDRDQVDALALPGTDQHVAGAEGVAGLDSGHPGRHRSSSSLIVVIRRGGWTLRSTALRASAILAKAGIAQQVPGQGRQVGGAGVVAALVEPDRVGVVGVGEAERRRVAVHLGDEALRPSRPPQAPGRRRRRCRCAGSGRRAGRAR